MSRKNEVDEFKVPEGTSEQPPTSAHAPEEEALRRQIESALKNGGRSGP